MMYPTHSQWYCWQQNGLDADWQMSLIHERKPITVWCHKPGHWHADAPVVFVMHGARRNAQKCRDAWIKHSERRRFLLLVPEFSKEYYPGIRTYHLGNTFSSAGKPIAESKWTYRAIEHIFDTVKAIAQFRTDRYSIYGHSAGAQFVHRLVLFLPDARINTAICANAGWYTIPSYETRFPYGLKASGIAEGDLKKAFEKRLLILVGNKDTNTNHKYLKQSPQARAQGENRYERGYRFYEIAQRESEKLHALLKWEFIVVQDVGHSSARMSKEASKKLSS